MQDERRSGKRPHIRHATKIPKRASWTFSSKRFVPLPFSQTVLPFVVPGTNYVDLHSEAGGRGGCGIAATLTFLFNDKRVVHTTVIRPEKGTPTETRTGLVTVETLYGSGGPKEKETINPYGTYSARGTFRLCERMRLTFNLTSSQISRSDVTWLAQLEKRRNEISCEIGQRRRFAGCQ
jgi:hypothetical protein